MAGSRSRLHKSTKASPSVATRRSTRRGKVSQEESTVPEAFQDLLSEATASKAAGEDEDSKPLKKRKTARSARERVSSPPWEETPRVPAVFESQPPQQPSAQVSTIDADNGALENVRSRTLQTIEDSDETDDSDQEWEDALEQGSGEEDEAVDDTTEPEVGDLSITIGGEKGKELEPAKKSRRRGITSVDKKVRLGIHKMHVLCLLSHIHRRNAWCNDEKVQATLRKIIPSKTLSKLIPNPDQTQWQASKQLLEGMQDLRVLWTNHFVTTAFGLHKPRWLDPDAEVQAFTHFDNMDHPMDRQDFRSAASSLRGSQDVGAQLFCALLRSIGYDARLVCSLQCLPFASSTQASTPQKPGAQKNIVHLDPYNARQISSPTKSKQSSSRAKPLSRLERAMGERHPALSSGVAPKSHKKYHTDYPVYWVEVFNPANQKWVSIDPMSTLTVDKPTKIEPPLNDHQNSLAYVVAFEDDLSAKDVTRRYAKAYNAKTRRFRIDCTEAGAKWWKKSLKPFRRPIILDRDQVEDATLARREAAEGMPKNVQDFKNHPIYVLERHLKHNEVIHPMHPAGKVNVGTSMKPKMETIYRRKDVHLARSADKWYRLGRDVLGGEQPLKHAKPRKRTRRSVTPELDGERDEQQEELGAGLYAEFQTELYIPPPVVGGRVPRNAYGNLDLYVPSMVPGGGVHIRHKLAAKAARIVAVDYVEAVTGFSFKGRHGTAVVQGVVVAQEYEAAVEAVIEGMEYAQEEAENSQRSSEALRLWRRFYLGLKIAQRVNAIEIDGETGPVIDVQEEIEREDKVLSEQQLAGGFFIDEAAREVGPPKPTARRHFRRIIDDDDDDDDEEEEYGGGFIPASEGVIHEPAPALYSEAGGFIPETTDDIPPMHHLSDRQGTDRGGGFLLDEDDANGGGFIQEPSLASLDQLSGPHESVALSPHTVEPATGDSTGIIANHDPILKENSGHVGADDRDSQQGTREVISPEAHIDDTRLDRIDPKDPVPDVNGEDSRTSPVAEIALLEKSASPPSSPSEAGSLPLEDPEDEDADPEWLVDVT